MNSETFIGDFASQRFGVLAAIRGWLTTNHTVTNRPERRIRSNAAERIQECVENSSSALWALVVLGLVATGSTMVSLARSPSTSDGNSELYRQVALFGEVLEHVRADYVEKPNDRAAD